MQHSQKALKKLVFPDEAGTASSARKNPVKIAGVKEAFEKYYTNVEVEGISVPGTHAFRR